MQNDRQRLSLQNRTILRHPYKGLGGALSVKSPSVPNFHDRMHSEHSSSDSALVKENARVSDNRTVEPSCLGQASPSEHDGNLSVIDLYGDEVESQRAEGDYDDDEEDYDDDCNYDRDEVHSDDLDLAPGEDILDDVAAVTSKSSTADGINNPHFDRYGFKKQNNFISEADYDKWWAEYSQYCVRRKHKWQLLLEKSGLPVTDDSPSRFPPKSERLKRYVRKGIPAEWRGNAWWHFARGQEKLNKNKGVYSQLLQKMKQIKKQNPNEKQVQDLDIIERDLNRTFPDNTHFQSVSFNKGPPIIKSLRRVLVAFSLYNPKIGYCQSMNFLAGLLLLFLDEERAFWMLVIITSRYLPGVHNINLEGVNIDQGVLMLCVKEYIPEVWSYIKPSIDHHQKNNKTFSPSNNKVLFNMQKNEFLYRLPPITLCTASWFMSCFVGVVPIETTLRIWDCLFYEESHFLFKFSLAVLKLSEHELSKIKPRVNSLNHSWGSNSTQRNGPMGQEDSDMEIFQVIQTFPKTLLNPNEIFEKIIFKRRFNLNRLDQDEIDRCRKFVAAQRLKFKTYGELLGNTTSEADLPTTNDNTDDKGTHITSDAVNEALSSEVYGFKKSLAGVHWNNSIKEKVKQMRKKKDRSD
ncbi:msb3p [Saccharomyces arboricola H-6]|uniref:Msb3p n=1 Tax=Saccharomyces arboricola (strain H-6 / AS 2.3317 / CBS 10644) TaxID=1160507 RepID=J8Q3F5_SACAR|nr:msb3p [Saccharomyces arboricola H-6]